MINHILQMVSQSGIKPMPVRLGESPYFILQAEKPE
jgi:hypothetical protein